MQIKFSPQSLDPLIRDTISLVKNKAAFMKNWANSVAMKARETARSKPGRRWWKELARSIWVRSVSETTVDVGTDYRGAALKQYGGEVKPVDSKALAIPIAEEAEGKFPYEFERADRELFVIPSKSGNPNTIGILGYSDSFSIGMNMTLHEFTPLFVLSLGVKMKPDPWFPNDGEISVLAHREALIQLRKDEAIWNH